MSALVQYNEVIINHPVVRITESQSVYSESGRTLKYVIIQMTVIGWLFHPLGGDSSNITFKPKPVQKEKIIADLHKQGSKFIYMERGEMVFEVVPFNNSTNSPESLPPYRDIMYGPKPVSVKELDNTPGATQIAFVIQFAINPIRSGGLADGLFPNMTTANQVPGFDPVTSVDIGGTIVNSALIDHTAAVQYTIDQNHYTTRTITGQITVAGSYGVWDKHGPDVYRSAVLNTSPFLANSVLRPPENMIRVSYDWNVRSDGITLDYRIVDREEYAMPPVPCTDYNVSISVTDTEYQLGAVEKVVSGYYVLPQDAILPDDAVNVLNQTFFLYVLSDPDAIVFVHHFSWVRKLMNTMTVYTFEISCVHLRQDLYSADGLLNIGLFSDPSSLSAGYNYSGPYGYMGLYGDGYNPDQFDSSFVPVDTGSITRLNGNVAFIRNGADITQLGVFMFEEKAQVRFVYTPVAVVVSPTEATPQVTTQSFENSTTCRMFVMVAGYKMKLSTQDDVNNGTASPPIPSARQKFNIVDLKGTDPPDTTIDGVPGKSPPQYPARIVKESNTNFPPIPSKANSTTMYRVGYAFCVELSSVIVQPILQALKDKKATVDGFVWSTSLDGLLAQFSSLIQGPNTK